MKNRLETQHLDLGFEVPRERIAQRPPAKRGTSRLLLYEKRSGNVSHYRFGDLPQLLAPGTLLVLNDTRVTPCRLLARKETGGRVDILLARWIEAEGQFGTAEVIVRSPGRGARDGMRFSREKIEGVLAGRTGSGRFLARLSSRDGSAIKPLFASCALMPLPPYVRRLPDAHDLVRYQTVFSRQTGSIAAPTAGLHFTAGIMEEAGKHGVELVRVTLHIGEGTFRPIRTRYIEDHKMQGESFTIAREAAGRIARAMRSGGSIVAVGTSCVRALEGVVHETGRMQAWSGQTSIFITPGFRFKVTRQLLTNFHTPASTPLSLVASLIGIEDVRRIYREALDAGYMFFSYGDAMLVLDQ